MEAIEELDVIVYTKIFLKFPYKFWPGGAEKEFFIYAHERRGYYTFWQVSILYTAYFLYDIIISIISPDLYGVYFDHVY